MILLLFTALLSGCGESGERLRTVEDFKHAVIGIQTGSSYESLVKEMFPEAERRYYTQVSDMIVSVEQGKIDGFPMDKPLYQGALWEGADLSYVREPLQETSTGFIFAGGEDVLRDQMNGFLRDMRQDGTLDRLQEKWFGDTEPEEHPDLTSFTREKGTLRVALSVDCKPLCYKKGDLCTGYEVELLSMFAQAFQYDLEIEEVAFESIIAGLKMGKYDVGAAGFTIMPERGESVDFSEPHMTVDAVMVIAGGQEKTGFIAEMKRGFEKTFLRENRWEMILQGIGLTIFISICSAVGGSALGFGLYLLSRSENRRIRSLACRTAKIYSGIVAGTPVVVILMFLFYVVFGQVKISGIPVAILCFSLTFGAFVYDNIASSVESVDIGQTEAAYALGYPRDKAFFHIVLPQAMRLFLTGYNSELVSLVQSTSVVGYIAVNDLTKVSDIIRSNTYEAFFPLLVSALTYFLLTGLLTSALSFARLKYDPKRRSEKEILKGITVQGREKRTTENRENGKNWDAEGRESEEENE